MKNKHPKFLTKSELRAAAIRKFNVSKNSFDFAWIDAIVVSTVQSICLEDGLPDCPGFVVQEEGSSPPLTLVFEDRKTADECTSAMKHIFDSALSIRGRV
jgi:hypothetical protein